MLHFCTRKPKHLSRLNLFICINLNRIVVGGYKLQNYQMVLMESYPIPLREHFKIPELYVMAYLVTAIRLPNAFYVFFIGLPLGEFAGQFILLIFFFIKSLVHDTCLMRMSFIIHKHELFSNSCCV